MSDTRILDLTTVKDLLNHIYEKRKSTAFQIEGLTKSALASSDSATINKIIAELTELANGGSNSAKMGAITALGSVSVALGSFAIAYFLEDIVRPIFATFRDTDARVRYYACESLYNIAKIARGEILLYFNEVFDILCILVTDTESSVKNAADILDRLVKDIVSAKLTTYVSILHQQNEEADIQSNIVLPDGVAVQVNEIQDPLKAFLLPKFIPTLLERMYTIEPFAKKFLLSWLELFDDIPSSELITFLPNFLEPLIRFLMNNCPSDVRIETQNLLNIFLKEIRAIYKVRYEVKRNRLLKEKKKKRAERLRTQAQSTPEVDEAQTKLVLTEKLKDFSITPRLETTDDDSLSIKSSSTTIIRKPNQDEKSENGTDVNEKDEMSDDEGSVFINGQDIFIDYPRIINILLSFLRTGRPIGSNDVKFNDLAGESHDIFIEIQSTVLKWLQEIISISPTSFSKFLPDCVSIIMQNVALTDINNDVDLNNQFLEFNSSLKSYLLRLNGASSNEDNEDSDDLADLEHLEISESTIQGLNTEVYDEFLELYLGRTLQVVTKECLLSLNELARLTLLDWLAFLYTNYPTRFSAPESELDDGKSPTNKYTFDLTSLLKLSTDASNQVISKVLELASQISEENQEFFKHFIVRLVTFFESDGSVSLNGVGPHQTISRSKVEFVIRRFCVSISSKKIFKAFSEVLVKFEDTNLEFVSNLVVTLNNILLTSHELQDLRKELKNLDIYKNEDWDLFSTLFQSWCHNVPSALSLCLLTSNYELSYLIIKSLADLEVTFQLLTQLDILVQLLESHIFLKLRLQLLEPEKNPYLYKTLFGILMIMPQSSTYTTLKNRLTSLTLFVQGAQSAPILNAPVSTPGMTPGSGASQLSIKRKRIQELADKFVKVNGMHEKYLYERRLRESMHDDENSKSNGKRTTTNVPHLISESRPLTQEYFAHTTQEKNLSYEKPHGLSKFGGRR